MKMDCGGSKWLYRACLCVSLVQVQINTFRLCRLRRPVFRLLQFIPSALWLILDERFNANMYAIKANESWNAARTQPSDPILRERRRLRGRRVFSLQASRISRQQKCNSRECNTQIIYTNFGQTALFHATKNVQRYPDQFYHSVWFRFFFVFVQRSTIISDLRFVPKQKQSSVRACVVCPFGWRLIRIASNGDKQQTSERHWTRGRPTRKTDIKKRRQSLSTILPICFLFGKNYNQVWKTHTFVFFPCFIRSASD